MKARACMLFPRTQFIQVQEEYFNVGLSYELFLRAFGELDILHEEQVKDDRLDGYQVLVSLRRHAVARARWPSESRRSCNKGGVVIADCVPRHGRVQAADDRDGGSVRREGRQDRSHPPLGSLGAVGVTGAAYWANRPAECPGRIGLHDRRPPGDRPGPDARPDAWSVRAPPRSPPAKCC